MIADDGANACYIQGGVVDTRFKYNFVGGIAPEEGDTLDQVVDWLALIRERGMVPGLGTHRAYIITEAEKRGYDTEFYTTTMNTLGIYCEYHAAVMAINRLRKPVVAIKTLGGGLKTSPENGLTVALASLKPTDILAVGVENEESVEHNAALVQNISATLAAARDWASEPSAV